MKSNIEYVRLVDNWKRELLILDKYTKVNEYLKDFEWYFVCPLFFYGYDLYIIEELAKKSNTDKLKIYELIHNRFYDLSKTISFVDGYAKRCIYIMPFLHSIENSLILAYQKDYEGAIKTLIPIVEGIIRKYLINEKSSSYNYIKQETLIKGFQELKTDLSEGYKKNIQNYQLGNTEFTFNFEEQQELIGLHKLYVDKWFNFLMIFINDSFYKNSINGDNLTKGEINRHSILHEFGLNTKYDFESFIKVYFIIQFLTWIFLQKENKSLLCEEIDRIRLFEKIKSYEKIIESTNKIAYDKHLILKDYNNYDATLHLRNERWLGAPSMPFLLKLGYNLLDKLKERQLRMKL